MTQNDMTSNATTLGERLRAAREEQRLSVTKLAYAIGVDPRTVARWQDDESVPSISRLAEVAQILGKPVSYFVDEVAA